MSIQEEGKILKLKKSVIPISSTAWPKYQCDQFGQLFTRKINLSDLFKTLML